MTVCAVLENPVSAPTVCRDTSLNLIDFAESDFADFGITGTRVSNGNGTKAALYAHVGSDIAGGVVLSGHTDVVPADDGDIAQAPQPNEFITIYQFRKREAFLNRPVTHLSS
ncbi:acetylornithine deacetylase [Cognatiyoonia koreensis]|uniref:Acetylornithine deacetylase n=1 Tax=Cognatiyoonia koreensis TaxID=364200 RepID=A0A1I0NIM8_9RHOB|nr:hypothetical protein [Cognatiyoonia koreensis]SEW01332.1 acetylornithine deacetylase [Cognatiyoonia koreensis]